MDDKITIIEGPPPTFEAVADGWAIGLNESPNLYAIARTNLRTFNGPALIERCHRAWRHGNGIDLEYRESDGLQHSAPIMAARAVETDEGNVIQLWVRLEADEVDFVMDDDNFDADFGDDLDSDDDDPSDSDDFDDLDSNLRF